MNNTRTYPVEFVEWVATFAYKDIRGKYRVYKHIEKISFNSVEDLYNFYLIKLTEETI